MSYTVQQVLTEALSLIGVIAIDETPTTSELNTALRSANIMLGRWASQHFLVRADTSFSFTLTANQAAYTIGASGADFTATKPLKIYGCYVTDSSSDYPLEIVTPDFYDTLTDKNLATSRPMYVAYDPGAAQQSAHKGTLSFYNTPDKAYTGQLDYQAYFTEFVNLSDVVTFEPAYYEAIIYNLAVRVFRKFHDAKIPVPEDIAAIAATSLSNLRTLNSTPILAAIDIPGSMGGVFNPYTGE